MMGASAFRPYAYHAYPRGRKYLGRAIRTSRYRMVEWTNRETSEVEYELYDYERDPHETVNLAGLRPGVLEEMKGLLGREREGRYAPVISGE